VSAIRIVGFYDLIPRNLSGEVILKYRTVDEDSGLDEIDEEDLQERTLTEDADIIFEAPINIYSVKAAESCSYWMYVYVYAYVGTNESGEQYLGISVSKFFYSDNEPFRGLSDVRSIVVTQEAWDEALAEADEEDEDAQITIIYTPLPEVPGYWGTPNVLNLTISDENYNNLPATINVASFLNTEGMAVFDTGVRLTGFNSSLKELTLYSISAPPWLSDIRKIVIKDSAFHQYGTTKITVEHSAIGAGRRNAQSTEFTEAGEYPYSEGIRIHGMTRLIGSGELYSYATSPDDIDNDKILTLD
jgi:hypothetical protein